MKCFAKFRSVTMGCTYVFAQSINSLAVGGWSLSFSAINTITVILDSYMFDTTLSASLCSASTSPKQMRPEEQCCRKNRQSKILSILIDQFKISGNLSNCISFRFASGEQVDIVPTTEIVLGSDDASCSPLVSMCSTQLQRSKKMKAFI